jgi:protein phosphatase
LLPPLPPPGTIPLPRPQETPLLRLETAALTHVGRRRLRNEDAFVLAPELGLAVVADGMGGHPAGDVASGLAGSEVRSHFSDPPARSGGPPQADPRSRSALGEAMAAAVVRADARIRSEADSDPGRAGMGTTLTALVIARDEGRAVIGHVGDSRAYMYERGGLRQLTRDHTWVQQQIEAGALAPEDAHGHPWAHVLSQALGVGDGIACDVIERETTPGQVYLLCTDGLTTMLPDVAIERTLGDALPEGLDAAAQALVDAANEQGGVDNITVVLVAIEP